jgi:integrase
MSVKKKYRMFLRGSVYWVQDNFTRKQTSLGVKDKDEAEQLLQAKNEAHRQPIINLQIARAYLSVSDPKAATRTWGDVMRHIVDQKHGETKHRWETAIKDKALSHLHALKILDTIAEDFWLALNFKKVSTNVYLRRIHNFALGSNWLPVPVLQKSIWPKVRFKEKRATTHEEHRQIIEAEKNTERRAFYDLAWHLGASQGDIANLNAEDIDWENRIITYKRSKTGVEASMRFGKEVERVISDLPSTGPLFPYFYYLIVAILLDLSAFETWQGVARIFIFSGSLHGGEYLGITCGVIIAFFRLSSVTTPGQKEPITEYVGGTRLLSHGMALRVANAILFNRARSGKKRKKLPKHMKTGVKYTMPSDSELDAMEPVEDIKNNMALTAYVSKENELDTVQWGMLRIPYSETENHFLVVGTTGSGKTILLRQLMKSVLGKIENKEDFRAFVYDNKPDFMPFARSLGLEEYVWNLDPFDPKGCVWDIAKDVTDQATAKQVTEVLVSVDPGLKEPYFQQAVHGLFEAVLIRLREVAGERWTFRDAIVVFDYQYIIEKFLTSEQTARLADSFIKAGRSYKDVRASIRAKLRPYDIAAALWSRVTDKKKKVSVIEWSKTNKILVVTHRDNFEKAIKPINQAIFRMVSLTLLSRFDSLTRSSWVFMDEIREIGVLQGYHALANKGRSKGVRLAIGFQTIEGLITEHKDENAAYELANIIGNKTFLHSNSDITCAWAARHGGTCDVKETVFSHSTTWGSSPSSSVSETTKIERKEILAASHFEANLKKVTPESGLTAINKVSSIGAYVSWVPFECQS